MYNKMLFISSGNGDQLVTPQFSSIRINNAIGSTDAELSLENTLPPLLRLRSLASGSETFACKTSNFCVTRKYCLPYKQKTKLSLPPDGFQGITRHRFNTFLGKTV